jgi:hypothetical protein
VLCISIVLATRPPLLQLMLEIVELFSVAITLQLTSLLKDLPSERARIEALGGSVDWVGEYDKVTGLPIEATGVYRVNRNLALSRSIGLRLLLLFNPSTSPSGPQETWT